MAGLPRRADPRGPRSAALSARQPARAARPRPLPLPETGSGAARGSSGYKGGRDSTMEGGSSRREVVAADPRWGPGGGGRDAPSSFSSSRRRRPPECGRGLRGMSVQCGREPRPLPSAPPLSLSSRLAPERCTPASRGQTLLPFGPQGSETCRPRPSSPLGGGDRGRRRRKGGKKEALPVAPARSARNVTKNRRARGI